MWGSGIQPGHIVQGQIGDCYAIAALSAMAENPYRVKNMFLTQSLNAEGIVAMRVFIKGKPSVMTIEDKIPYGTTTPLFLRAHSDSAYWPLFGEKIFAKIMVNYEMIGWGWMAEAL